MQTVTLGDSGINVSRLSIGTGTNGWNHQSDQTRLGLAELADLLRFAHDHGVRFWDAADMYGSHEYLREALKTLDRSSVTITTKATAATAEGMRADLDRFKKEIGTDYIDIVLLHCMTQSNWPERYAGPMEALNEAKARGEVRAMGVSCHDFGAFQTAANTDWVEIVLARINYAQKHMDATPAEVIRVMERMHASGKGIYGMKVMGCGDLGSDPEKAFRFVMGLDCVDAMTVGMVRREEVIQNVGIVESLERERVMA
jgi:aryl-alcohol dehydrogenase-like predicted oxidoreductase